MSDILAIQATLKVQTRLYQIKTLILVHNPRLKNLACAQTDMNVQSELQIQLEISNRTRKPRQRFDSQLYNVGTYYREHFRLVDACMRNGQPLKTRICCHLHNYNVASHYNE